ncbi:MAG: hypothetical protein JWM44_603 [Bacilli bacterium]|jgi:uncharacterized protein YlaN (UPF0358 family)|nr:hypothetical protein [Bacilli bacterium]
MGASFLICLILQIGCTCVLLHFRLKCGVRIFVIVMGGSLMSSSELLMNLNIKAYNLLQEDADKIAKLIEVQMENLTTRKCPLYEEVLDTQMYGLSREVDFAIRAGLVTEQAGKMIVAKLERNLAMLYEALNHKE